MTENPPTPPPPTKPSLHLNWEDWLPYLEDNDAPIEMKRQFIETVWSILMSFADLGWELDAGSENSGKSLDLTAFLEAAMLYSAEHHLPSSSEAVEYTQEKKEEV